MSAIISVTGFITAIWLTCGGIIDVKDMFRRLKSAVRNYEDDGMVIDHRSRGEKLIEQEQRE